MILSDFNSDSLYPKLSGVKEFKMGSYEENLSLLEEGLWLSQSARIQVASIALFREDLVAFRILCCRVVERLLHFSFSIMFHLKRFQKHYLERPLLKYGILSL